MKRITGILVISAMTTFAAITSFGAEPFSVKVVGSGPPILLIPGLASGPNVWDSTVAHYKDHYSCHVFTLAGFAGQPAVEPPFLPAVRDGIIKYIHDKKLKKPVIIGHSLGGILSYAIAETAPADVGPIIAVDGLPFYAALMNADATAESAKPMAEQMKTRYAAMTPQQFVANNHQFLSLMISSPSNVTKVATLGDKSDPKAVGQAFYEIVTTDLRPNLKAITSPVLLIGAGGNASSPEERTQMMDAYAKQISAIPNHKLVIAEKAKHFIMFDDPTFLFATMDSFLKDNPAK